MKVQRDSFEERPESPEPLYEEVGDFGLQVLKSLETSFLSGGHAETLEVSGRPMSLSPHQTASLDRSVLTFADGFSPTRPLRQNEGSSLEALSPDLGRDPHGSGSGGDSPVAPLPRRRQRRPCSPSQELLLQELSSVFTKRPEPEAPQPAEDEAL